MNPSNSHYVLFEVYIINNNITKQFFSIFKSTVYHNKHIIKAYSLKFLIHFKSPPKNIFRGSQQYYFTISNILIQSFYLIIDRKEG